MLDERDILLLFYGMFELPKPLIFLQFKILNSKFISSLYLSKYLTVLETCSKTCLWIQRMSAAVFNGHCSGRCGCEIQLYNHFFFRGKKKELKYVPQALFLLHSLPNSTVKSCIDTSSSSVHFLTHP